MTYEGTAVKSLPMTKRRITNPMPQSSFSRKLSGESVCNQSQGLEDKDKQEWNAACEDMLKKMLRYLEERVNLQVNLRELKEQFGLSERAGQCIVQIAKLARNERGKKLCQICRKEENEVHIASLARWDAQLKGLAMLERRCQELMEEVEF